MPLVRLISLGDNRLPNTLDATPEFPDQGGVVSNGLVCRYNVEENNVEESADGLEGGRGRI